MMTIPHSTVVGTFYTATGEARAYQTVVFEPQSTPYTTGEYIVLSVPIRVTLSATGSLPVNFELAAGGYRVVADTTDAFFINVPGAGATVNLSDLVTLSDSFGGNQQVGFGVTQLLNVFRSSQTVLPSALGERQTLPYSMVFFGNSGALGTEEVGGVATFVTSLSPKAVGMLGGGNPGATPANWDDYVGAFLAPWIPNYVGGHGSGSPGAGVRDAVYSFGLPDWYSSALTDALDYFAGTGVAPARYFRKTFASNTGYSVDVFALSTASSEPDGRGANSVQAQWLQAQLAASTARWKLVLLNEVPYCSVAGEETEVLRWPFAAWGADAVLGAGPAVYERLTVDDLPYFVLGGANANPAIFGTPSAYSTVRYNARRTVLLVNATEATLSFRAVPVGGETIVDSLDLEAPVTPFMRFFTLPAATGGLKVADTGGLAVNWPISAAQHGELVNVQQLGAANTWGVIRRVTSLPTAEEVSADPTLRTAWLQLGDDPPEVFYWNATAEDWCALVLNTPATAYSTGLNRLQTAAPTLTAAGTGAQGVQVTHASPAAVSLWYSWDGLPFTLLTTWPTQQYVPLPTGDPAEHFLAVYCTTLDNSKTPSPVATLRVLPA